MAELLFLAHRVPYPPDRGDKIRSFHILKHLAERQTLHLAAFADDEADVAHAEALRPLVGGLHVERRTVGRGRAMAAALLKRGAASVTAFHSRGMRYFIERILAERPIDRLYVFSGQMAQYAPGDRPFVMDFADMDSEKFAAYANAARGPMRWVWRREARRLFAAEREAARRAAVSLFVSDAEAALFRQRTGLSEARVQTLENGIDLEHYRPQPWSGEPLVVFTGQMDYPPNIEAVSGFARHAWPRVRAAAPEARFAIVGRRPDPAVAAWHGRDGIEVTGEVADVQPWLARAAVVVAPLRIARGVQNKVLEAMATARAVVASPQAFEGIAAEPGRELIVARGWAEEAEAVAALLADPARAAAIGAAARARIEARYGWDARLAPLDAMMAHI